MGDQGILAFTTEQDVESKKQKGMELTIVYFMPNILGV